MFQLPSYVALRRLPGVKLVSYVQCPFGSISEKRTSMLVHRIELPRWRFKPSCPHRHRWFRYEDSGEWLWTRRQTLLGKRRVVLAEEYTAAQHEQPTDYLTKAASAYPPEMNRQLAIAMATAVKRHRHTFLQGRLHEAKAMKQATVQTTVRQSHHLRSAPRVD
mgnify:CR=1 FL=1